MSDDALGDEIESVIDVKSSWWSQKPWDGEIWLCHALIRIQSGIRVFGRIYDLENLE